MLPSLAPSAVQILLMAALVILPWQGISLAAETPAAEAASTDTASPAAPAETISDATPQDEPPAAPSESAAAEPEPRLRFNFRFQRWIDVLEWFAEQADLSLVLDAPPPGSFNYSDQREYTPAEAIDLLNGVLLTKGYTLVRRERMLIVVNLEDGIPETLVPRVTLDELNQRGRFELVSVLFPVGRRSVQETIAEITPLLGRYGKAVPLAKTSQVLVTDTAGVMRLVAETINAIPEPQTTPVEPRAKKDESPQLQIYPVGAANADIAINVLTQLLPDAKVALDAKTRQINVYAMPSEQAVAATVLEQMRTPQPAENQPSLEIYPIEKRSVAELRRVATIVAPHAQISSSPKNDRLIVWAMPDDHAALRDAIAKLGGDNVLQTESQLEVHELRSANPAATLGMLQGLLPDATLLLDPSGRRLIALAPATDQQMLRVTLDDLQSEGAGTTELRFYPLGQRPSPNLLPGLQALAPSARLTLEADGNRLMVIASPEDQKIVSQALTRIESAMPPEEPRQLKTYPATAGQRQRFEALLPTLAADMPGVQLLPAGEPGTLSVWAKPTQHAVLTDIIAQLGAEAPDAKKNQLVAYPLAAANPETVTTMLRTLFPSIQMVHDPKTRRLAVWASAEDHATIKAALDEMDADAPAETLDKVMVYPLGDVPPHIVMSLLQSVVPEARLMPDHAGRRLVVQARAPDQEIIAKTLDQMRSGVGEEDKWRLEVYPTGNATATSMTSMLSTLAPTARIVPDTAKNTLTIWASPEDHETLRGAVEKMAQEESEATAPKMVAYELAAGSAGRLIPMLRAAAPQSQISMGVDNQQLIVWARPAEHEKIKQLVDELSMPESPETAARAVVYTLEATTAGSAIQVLAPSFPEVRFSVGKDPYQLVAMARPAEHELLKTAIEAMTEESAGEDAATMVVYTLQGPLRYQSLASLNAAFPRARFATGADPRQLIAWARPIDHEKIKDLVEQMTRPEPAESAPRAVVYTLETTTAASALPVLRPAFPDATFTVGSDPRQLIAMARPGDQALIKAAIENMAEPEPAETAPRMEVYTLQTAGAATSLPILRQAFSDATFTLGADQKSIIAWARPETHSLIGAAVEQIEAAGSANERRVMAVYSMRYEDTAALLRVLDPLLQQQATFVTDPNRDGLIVWAEPDQQEAIGRAIDEFTSKLPKTREPVSRVYPFQTADPQAALAVLTRLVPNARMAVDAGSRSLVASATPDEQEQIKATVDEMERTGADTQSPELRAHRVATADPIKVVGMLRSFFHQRPDVQLSVDPENDTILVVAMPKDHDRIQSLITQVEEGGTPETASQVQVYSLKNVDSVALISVLNSLLEKQRANVQLSLDPRGDQLVAIARPKEQAIIHETVEKMRTDERQMEIVQLDVVEPETAVLAIRRLFSDGAFGYDPSAPVIDSDEDTQQLFIRATPEQHVQIRQLLLKMGETRLGGVVGGKTRVVPFGGDVRAALDEIQRVWPQLHDNPIRVASPESDQPKTNPPATKAKPEPDAKRSPKPAASPAEQSDGKSVDKAASRAHPTPWAAIRLAAEQQPTAEANAVSPTAPSAPAPIVLIPGEGSITVQCDDPEALAAMESLLRSMAPKAEPTARNIEVFALRHSDAVELAARLEEMFRRMTPQWQQRSSQRTTIMADERLNAIVVRGSRSDRATVAGLVQMLDRPETPDSATPNQPTLVPIENTQASRVEQVVREVFRAQLTSPGRSSSARLAPQITVDDASNALVVMAPEPLLEQIITLARQLDRAAGDDSAHTLELIPLEKTNALRVQRALDATIQRSSRRGRR